MCSQRFTEKKKKNLHTRSHSIYYERPINDAPGTTRRQLPEKSAILEVLLTRNAARHGGWCRGLGAAGFVIYVTLIVAIMVTTTLADGKIDAHKDRQRQKD